jgi:DNA (cytosine-5)-methyltransferase 1
MNALSLFSGIGGIDLAAEWAGIKTVAFCERESFPQKVLKKHWPDIPIYDDVCTLTKERLEADGIKSIDIIHGGYPCQPYSEAGNQRGKEDNRHLWPQFARLIEEIRPHWVVGENVSNHVEVGLDDVLSDLEAIDYTAQAFLIPACAVQAPHQRDRVFVVANASSQRLPKGDKHTELLLENIKSHPGTWNGRGLVEPGIQRVVDGVSDQLDRLKSLGNAVVPQQIYPIFEAIMKIEAMNIR